MVECGELVVARVVIENAPRFSDLFFGFCGAGTIPLAA
jgi:hypothetical protein